MRYFRQRCGFTSQVILDLPPDGLISEDHIISTRALFSNSTLFQTIRALVAWTFYYN